MQSVSAPSPTLSDPLLEAKPLRLYTRSEVASAASVESVLVIILNGVYDLTSFVELHPGGGSVLFAYVGRDATGGFEAIGHSVSAHEWMKQYKVGEIVATERL